MTVPYYYGLSNINTYDHKNKIQTFVVKGEILNSLMKCPYGTPKELPQQFKLPVYSYSLLFFKHPLAEYGLELSEIIVGIQNHMMYSVRDALTEEGYK